LTTARPPQASYPSDIFVPFAEYSEIIVSMDMGFRKLISEATLEALTENQHIFFRRKGFKELADEINSGKCVLIRNSAKEFERLVAVAILHLENEDGNVFCQIGKLEEDKVVPDCKLPGSKQERGESMEDAIYRVLCGQLAVFEDAIEYGRTESTVKWMESKDFGIRTKYLRATQYATIRAEFEMPENSETVHTFPEHGLMILKNGVGSKVQSLVYSWLPQQEFDYFNSPDGKEDLLRKLSPVRPRRNSRLSQIESGQQHDRAVPHNVGSSYRLLEIDHDEVLI